MRFKHNGSLSRLYFLLTLVFMFVVVSCKTEQETPTPTAFSVTDETSHDFVKVELFALDQACFVRPCPRYKLGVLADGTVTYTGIADVLVLGESAGSISQSGLTRLVSQIEELDFFNLKNSYVEQVRTDSVTVRTCLTAGDKHKCITHYLSAHSGLDSLASTLEHIGLRSGWIGSRDQVLQAQRATRLAGPNVPSLSCETHIETTFNGRINTILPSSSGNIWIGGESGAAFYDPQSGLWQQTGIFDEVRSFAEESDGTLWLITTHGEIATLTAEGWQSFEEGQPTSVNAIAFAPNNVVWFAADNHIVSWDRAEDRWHSFASEIDGFQADGDDIVVTEDGGEVWFLSTTTFEALRYRPGSEDTGPQWKLFPYVGSVGNVAGSALQKENRIWFGDAKYVDIGTPRVKEVRVLHVTGSVDFAIDQKDRLWFAFGLEYILLAADPFGGNRDSQIDFHQDIGIESNIWAVAIHNNELWLGDELGQVIQCTLSG